MLADLQRVGGQLGGAHLTREGRSATFSAFARTMREQNFGIHRADQVGGRHLAAYVGARQQEGVSPRTLANELSQLRAVLCHEGKQGLARNPDYSNRALGVERANRIGTKTPLSDKQIKQFQDKQWRSAVLASAPRWNCNARSASARPKRSAADGPISSRGGSAS
ncbi:phage integrase N-terminal domain-containing protein [Hydrocarboniphaga sp.]|uniref:phage integrase N-terminal domain-containing protein n=1 Tax=Hydrocarboniphaga sp. TaxID=2033016 RepID=UPI002635763A|nr:phage integrase N-terminal domain-containing protein [Hydrocarboniphaga sp.]